MSTATVVIIQHSPPVEAVKIINKNNFSWLCEDFEKKLLFTFCGCVYWFKKKILSSRVITPEIMKEVESLCEQLDAALESSGGKSTNRDKTVKVASTAISESPSSPCDSEELNRDSKEELNRDSEELNRDSEEELNRDSEELNRDSEEELNRDSEEELNCDSEEFISDSDTSRTPELVKAVAEDQAYQAVQPRRPLKRQRVKDEDTSLYSEVNLIEISSDSD